MKKVIISKENIYGMARVGYINNNLEIYVNTDDGGNIPHFHIRDSNEWDKFHTCIKIESAEYFLHDGKEDKLNSRLRQKLQAFMQSEVKLKKYVHFENNWQLVCFLGDMNNSSVQISDDAIMPDYTKLS